VEIRLGGIYALERIARDSLERDYSTVIEVLSAYIRENTSQNKEADQAEAESLPKEPSTDIQAILNVLTRLRQLEKYVTTPEGNTMMRAILSLQGANLRGADFMFADLRFTAFQDANLQVANSRKANLHKAQFHRADLRGADLHDANLNNSLLYEADLKEASLERADLREADLRGADLREDQCGGHTCHPYCRRR
jgi:hypothetical protein